MSVAELNPDVTVYVGVVSATHSAGKTTLVSDLLDVSTQNTETEVLIRGSENIGYPWFRGGLLSIAGQEIPLVVAPEAATLYAQQNPDQHPTTEGYSFEHQLMIEGLAINLMTEAMIGAHELAISSGNDIALALLDRSALDGIVYSRILAPEHDQENISLAELTKKVLGFNSGGLEGQTFPWRNQFRRMLRQYCDFVVVPSYQEVQLTDNKLRIIDDEFRVQVDDDIRSYYSSVLGKDKMHAIGGDRSTRVAKLIDIIGSVINNVQSRQNQP